MKSFVIVTLALFVISPAVATAIAQTGDNPTCQGRVYSAKEVMRPARIIEQPNYDAIYEAFGPGIEARAVLDVVLCRSGRVSDIKVIEVSPPEIAEFFVKTISILRFTPAELNWHTVSQRLRLEYSINYRSRTPIDDMAAAGRVVEALQIIGNRRIDSKQFFSWIKTQVGETYDGKQVEQDLHAILNTGYFDKKQTRVAIEDGVRGGVVVNFEVVELPLIGEVTFEGLKLDRTAVVEALKREGVDLQSGTPCRPETVNDALRVIKLLVAANGHGESHVETRFEHVTAQKVNITFLIKPKQ